MRRHPKAPRQSAQGADANINGPGFDPAKHAHVESEFRELLLRLATRAAPYDQTLSQSSQDDARRFLHLPTLVCASRKVNGTGTTPFRGTMSGDMPGGAQQAVAGP
jgi:hypothetical protein